MSQTTEETAERVCPTCGCELGENVYEKNSVLYCCEPCATGGGGCECGCCHIVEKEEEEERSE